MDEAVDVVVVAVVVLVEAEVVKCSTGKSFNVSEFCRRKRNPFCV